MKELRSKLEVGQGVVVLDPKAGTIQRGKVTEVKNQSSATHEVKVKLDKEKDPRNVDPLNVRHDYGYLPKHMSLNGRPARLATA